MTATFPRRSGTSALRPSVREDPNSSAQRARQRPFLHGRLGRTGRVDDRATRIMRASRSPQPRPPQRAAGLEHHAL